MNQNQNKNMTDQEVTKELNALTKLQAKSAAIAKKINKIHDQIAKVEAQMNKKIHALESQIHKLQEPNRQLTTRRNALISKLTQVQLIKFEDKL